MSHSEWTGMAIGSAVAAIAISFLAIDAGVDVKPIAKRVEIASASFAGAVASRNELAFVVRALSRPDQDKPRLEHCLAVD